MSETGDHEERRQFNEEIARLKELVRDMKEYMRHLEGCSAPFGYGCKCLFFRVAERAEKAVK